MYRFTLSLADYLSQYVDDKQTEHNNCPICYENVMSMKDTSHDVKHIIDCYREDLVLRTMVEYHKQYDRLPELSDEFIDCVDVKIQQELSRYYESNRKLFDW